MRISKLDIVYLALPLVLWPLSFIVLKSVFIYALSGSVLILAALTIAFYRKNIVWVRGRSWIAVLIFGAAMAAVLYAVFVAGGAASSALGLQGYVSSVYASIYGSQGRGAATIALLALIGICEEVYWRGGVQGYAGANVQRFAKAPWIASTAYYTLVHVATLNPILVVAAFFVGLFTGLVAYKAGVLGSIAVHVIWIEMIVVLFPVVL
ncbi:MAG: CPBP family intramembrane metalloprotease [Candidatus Micrarchaeota archaeon]|nr:CPBP family intramembrane metalloprotease [Candidatus Micrarchaeota archaeon]